MSVKLKSNFISLNILDDNMYAKLERGKKKRECSEKNRLMTDSIRRDKSLNEWVKWDIKELSVTELGRWLWLDAS